ncbi:MAG: hypothetical protein ACRC7N_07890 [Clostridium sp.]
MYYAFPNNYFYKVETREDFDLNHKGTTIKWDELERKDEAISMKVIKDKVNNIVNKDMDESKVYDEIDENYVSEEISI